MYVWGRLARMAATTKSRGLFRPGDESRLNFRCLPSDIDRNMHLNNARYMMLADIGRRMFEIGPAVGEIGHRQERGLRRDAANRVGEGHRGISIESRCHRDNRARQRGRTS